MAALNKIAANKTVLGALIGGVTLGTIGALTAQPGERLSGFAGGAMAGAIMGGIGGYLYGVGKSVLAGRGSAANKVIGTTPL
jgi:hypothetical protein